ncbi:hypothetical protein ACLB1M_01435 [Escherichia coli]
MIKLWSIVIPPWSYPLAIRATNTTINGGEQYISSGGNATSTTINEGVQIVFDGGTASTTTINGGYQEISSGGLATNTIIMGEINISPVEIWQCY